MIKTPQINRSTTWKDSFCCALGAETWILCRSALRLHRAWYAQRSHYLPAPWGAAPSSGADEEVRDDKRTQETADKALPAHHLCHHPNICKVTGKTYFMSTLLYLCICSLQTCSFLCACVSRLVQKAELTRLSQTFLHVPQLHWIVVEDSPHKTPLVTDFLKKSGLTYTHLHMPTATDRKLQEVGWCQLLPKPTSDQFSLLDWCYVVLFLFSSVLFFVNNSLPPQGDPSWLKPRGVEQRNEALRWLREDRRAQPGGNSQQGVVYFADDDNTYSLQIFAEVDLSIFIHGSEARGLLMPAKCAAQEALKWMVSRLVSDEEHPASVSVASGAGWRDEVWEACGWGREGLYF